METRPSRSQARIEELESRVRDLESSRRRRPSGWWRSIVPAEATQHFRAAGREQLLGLRVLVDFWIKRLDDSDRLAQASRAEREEIPID